MLTFNSEEARSSLSAASAGIGSTDGARGSGEGGCEGGEEWLLLPEAEYVVAKNREAAAKNEKGVKLCRNKQYFRCSLPPRPRPAALPALAKG